MNSNQSHPLINNQQKHANPKNFSFFSCLQCWDLQRQQLYQIPEAPLQKYQNSTSNRFTNKISIKHYQSEQKNIKETPIAQTSSMATDRAQHHPQIQRFCNQPSFQPQIYPQMRSSQPMYNNIQMHPQSILRQTVPVNFENQFVKTQTSRQTTDSFLRNTQQSHSSSIQNNAPQMKLNFTYQHLKQTVLHSIQEQPKFDKQLTVNVTRAPPKIVHLDSLQSSPSDCSSPSPMTKLYKGKELLVSLELNKKGREESSSNQHPKIRRIPSLDQSGLGHGKTKLKVRQTMSIRQSEQDSDHVSIAISNSLLGSNKFDFTGRGLLVPIQQNLHESHHSHRKNSD